MSRAIRRGQSGSTQAESGLRRPLGSRQPRQTRGARPPTQRRRFRLKIPSFLEDIFSELRKVTWPTREETAYLTMVVLIVATAAGVALGLVDVVFNWLIDRALLE